MYFFVAKNNLFKSFDDTEIDYKEAADKFIELGNDFKKNLDGEMFPGQKKTVEGVKEYIDTVNDNVRRNVENLNKAKPEATGIKTPENDTEVNYTDYVNDETLNVAFSEILNNQDVNYDVDLAISNIINGRATEVDFEHFKPGNTANRQAFYETTGIKLPEDSRLSNYILNALNNKEKRIHDIYLKHNTTSLKQPDSLTVSDEDGIINTEKVIKSVGAKSSTYPIVNYPDTNIPVEFVQGTYPIYPPDHTMAGKGCKSGRQIDDIERLVNTYQCDADGWHKEKAIYEAYDEYGEIRKIELHWYQHDDVGKVEYKVKTKGGYVYVDEW